MDKIMVCYDSTKKAGEAMNSKLDDLQYALRRRALVNLYQINEDIVYTGYVKTIDQQGIIFVTFDDDGVSDGAVYLTFAVIEGVEFTSDDLDSMEFRISYARQQHFISYGQLATTYDNKRALVRQVTENAMVDEHVLMVTLTKDGQYFEGLVTRVSNDDFEFQLFDKFALNRQRTITVRFSEVALIEFEGKELTLMSLTMKTLKQTRTLPEKAVNSASEIQDALSIAQRTGHLISISSKPNADQFFVGRVNTLTKDTVVINLIDTAGQFGGYWLTRISAIERVTTQSDYLQVVATFVTMNQQIGVTKQPILNDERLFDATTDLFQEILTQAAKFRRVLRLTLQEGQAMVGLVSQIGGNQFIFHEVDQGQLVDPLGRLITISDVVELAFDYLEVLLIEHQLKSQGDLWTEV